MDNIFRKPSDVLVLGNGFDIHCGLKSSFRNFFECAFFDSQNKPIAERIVDNIWTLIFYYAFMIKNDHGGRLIKFVNESDPLWMNVEEYISKVFQCNKGGLLVLPLYDYIDDVMLSDESARFNEAVTLNGRHWSLIGSDIEQRYNIKQRTLELREQFGYRNTIDLLFGELKRFESSFSEYLSLEVHKKEEKYKRNIQDFVLRYIDNYGSRELFVLTFNYTTCFENNVYKENLYNVHGTLEAKNIIIGIDNNDGLMDDAYRFTKMSRRAMNNDNVVPLPDPEEIRSVIFYGCSLGMLDYSYYSYIFKKYNIGNSKIKLVFLYSDYEKEDFKNIENKEKYIASIRNLLSRYVKENNSKYDYDYLYSDGKIQICELEDFKNLF